MQFKMIRWKNIRFYWFGRFRYKFSDHLINHYEKNVPRKLMKFETSAKYFDEIDKKRKRYMFGLGK
mgnify:CR=1 FL=1